MKLYFQVSIETPPPTSSSTPFVQQAPDVFFFKQRFPLCSALSGRLTLSAYLGADNLEFSSQLAQAMETNLIIQKP